MQAHHAGPESDERIQDLQRRLADLRAGNASVLRTRLAHAHPWHVTRVARGVFLALTILFVVLLIAALTVPLVLPDLALLVREVEDALPLPLPMLVLFLALLMAVSWVTAGQAALAIARDCALLPWEDKERKKLESELSILTKATTGSGFVSEERFGEVQPLAMPQSRLGSNNPNAARAYPSPVPTAGGTLRYEVRPSFPPASGTGSLGGYTTPGGHTPAPPPGTPQSGTMGGSIIRKLTNPGAVRRATPASAPPRTPTPAPSLSYRGPGGQTRATPASAPPRGLDEKATPTSDAGIVYDRGTGATHHDPGGGDPVYTRRPHDSYTISPSSMGESLNDPVSGAASWKQPRFAQVDEPWLQDALSKAQSLSTRYPVQAFLEYSVEPDLPFTLVLERATPAMAVRAMVDFVGYLASIATPRRARIELRSVVHLDRSFYRSVMSAMEPYFPDTVEVRQQGYRVEITFLEPDRNWARYPILPIEE